VSERLAYLAGLFDGEGCVTFAPNYARAPGTGSLRAGVVNTDLDLLTPFRTAFGGRIVRLGRSRAHWRAAFQWYACGDTASNALVALRPFLVAKGPQVDLALQIRETSPGQRAPMIVRLGALKRVDHGGRFEAHESQQEYRPTVNTRTNSTITTTRAFPTAAKIARVIDLYLGRKNGTVRSMGYIGKTFGVAVPTVRNALVANGVAIRGRGRVAQNA